ncbi:MAG TPA: HAD-IA family hydrolase [Stenotrophomonas sp.]|jgi:putative hydrolase of the HAD superfamily
MPNALAPRLLLLDFDGVLANYHRPRRLAQLADHAGCTPAQVHGALFESGLETAYDAGQIGTDAYLQALGQAIGRPLDAAIWKAARLAACRPQAGVIARVAAIARHTAIAILTNNGALMAEVIPHLVPELLPKLQGRILCSGSLGGRKPQPEVFLKAAAQLDTDPRHTLFVDDLFVNVRGARAVGMQAETVHDSRSMGAALKRHRLLA